MRGILLLVIAMIDMKKLGENIRQARKIKGLTQEELAEKSNLSTMSIRRYEGGQRTITEKALVRIANALDVGIYEFFPKGEEIDIEGFPRWVFHPPAIVSGSGEQSAEEKTMFKTGESFLENRLVVTKVENNGDGTFSVQFNVNPDGMTVDELMQILGSVKRMSEETGVPIADIAQFTESINKAIRYAIANEIPRYRATAPPESTPAPQKGKDTTPPTGAPETPPEDE